jgi:hypothetical protein
MRSLVTMGSSAQLKGSSHPTAQEIAEDMRKAESEVERHKEEKKKKDGTVKQKKKKKTKEDGSGMVRKPLKGEKTQTPRISTSSFDCHLRCVCPE